MRKLLPLFCLIFFAILINAAETGTEIAGGGFEEPDWNITYWDGVSGLARITSDKNAGTYAYQQRGGNAKCSYSSITCYICFHAVSPLATYCTDTNSYWDEFCWTSDQNGSDLTIKLYSDWKIGNQTYTVATHRNVNFTEGAQYCLSHKEAPCPDLSLCADYNYATIDFVRWVAPPEPAQLVNVINEPTEPVASNTTFIIQNKVYDNNTGTYITDADVNLNFDNNGWADMAYNSTTGYYEYVVSDIFSGDFNYAIDTNKSGFYEGDYDEGTIKIRTQLHQCVTVSDTNNVESHSYNFDQLIIKPSDVDADMEFKLDNNCTESIPFDLNVFNSDQEDEQYFIHVSDNDENYTFESGLTFGTATTYNDPIQKLWDDNNSFYAHSFADTLTSEEEKWYKLKYQLPMIRWASLKTNADWFVQLEPSTSDINGVIWDIYQVSGYSNIRNYYLFYIPELSASGNVDTSYEFQFTAYLDENSGTTTTIEVGTTTDGDSDTDTTNTVTITNSPTRYSVPINSTNYKDYLLFKTDSSTEQTIYISDYDLIQRGYFKTRLELRHKDNSLLDAILIDNEAELFIKEGENFRALSTVYDRDGVLEQLKLEVYFDAVADTNRVRTYKYELITDDQNTIPFNILLDGIIDLNGYSGNPSDLRDVRVKATLIDNNSVMVETLSRWYKLTQFPHFPNDLTITATQIKRKVGENPEGRIYLQTVAPETIIGVKLIIYDFNSSLTAPEYTKTFYKDQDFICSGLDCSFDYYINDWKYEDQNIYTNFYLTLINTENENTDNNLTSFTLRQYIQYRAFQTARIFQVFERVNFVYTNTEPIPLVVQLRDEDYTKVLKNELKVRLKISFCDANIAGSCIEQPTLYHPTSFMYDKSTGYNMWFFKNVFLKETGELINDGNIVRIIAHIEDIEPSRRSELLTFPLLTAKCATYDTANFWMNALITLDEANPFSTGCGVGGYQSAIVTLTSSSSQEKRIVIDSNYTPTTPTQEALICINTDTNNVYVDTLKQDLVCVVLYTHGESFIDDFTLTIVNPNSDLSEKDPKKGQYIQTTIPFEVIAFNDPSLMKAALESGRRTTITTVGDFIRQALNEVYTGALNLIFEPVDEQIMSNVIVNIGADVNFDEAFSPTSVGGLGIYKIRGLKVINIATDYPDLKEQGVTAKRFMRYAGNNDIRLPRNMTTQIDFYISDIVKFLLGGGVEEQVFSKTVDSYFVIDETPKESDISVESVDVNQTTGYKKIPTILSFDIISDIHYKNRTGTIRAYVPIRLYAIILPRFNPLELLEDLIEDPAGTTIAFLFQNIVIILIVLFLAVIIAYIYQASKGGGTTINMKPPEVFK